MKYVLSLLFIVSTVAFFCVAERQTKYICSRNVMGDAIFTSEYATEEECNTYCTGLGAVCEETDIETAVGTEDVD